MSGDPFWHVIRAKGLDVPPAVLALHAGEGEKRLFGHCDITRGTGVLARLALWLAGFPPAGRNVPTRVTINIRDRQSAWVRDFDAHITRSDLSYDARRQFVTERFGAICLSLSLEADQQALHVAVERLYLFGLRVPRGLLPISTTTETEDASGRFQFDVSAHAPIVGFLIHYRGVLLPEETR